MTIFNYKNFLYDANLNVKSYGHMYYSFYEFGISYFESSLINLKMVLKGIKNINESDRLIFPIMFSFWHGVELLLKSCIIMCLDYNDFDKDEYEKNITKKQV